MSNDDAYDTHVGSVGRARECRRCRNENDLQTTKMTLCVGRMKLGKSCCFLTGDGRRGLLVDNDWFVLLSLLSGSMTWSIASRDTQNKKPCESAEILPTKF